MTETSHQPAAARTSGLAIASLSLGIIGFFAVPLLASIVAIVLGMQAQRDIARDPSLGGEGLARAGVILGWIGVALGVLGLIVGLIFIVAIL